MTDASDRPTDDEIRPLNVSIDTETIDPTGDPWIPIEVPLPSEGLPEQADVLTDTYIGIRRAFRTADGDKSVRPSRAFIDGIVSPSRVSDVENPHQLGKSMHVSTSKLVLPREPGEVVLGLGVFPGGPSAAIPRQHWDTDTVRILVDCSPDGMQARILPKPAEGRLSVEVYRPTPFDPPAIRLGPRSAFNHVDPDHGGGVRVAEDVGDELPTPVQSFAVAGHETHWILGFRVDETHVPGPEGWDGEPAVGLFPDGLETAIPAADWSLPRSRTGPMWAQAGRNTARVTPHPPGQ